MARVFVICADDFNRWDQYKEWRKKHLLSPDISVITSGRMGFFRKKRILKGIYIPRDHPLFKYFLKHDWENVHANKRMGLFEHLSIRRFGVLDTTSFAFEELDEYQEKKYIAKNFDAILYISDDLLTVSLRDIHEQEKEDWKHSEEEESKKMLKELTHNPERWKEISGKFKPYSEGEMYRQYTE